MWQRTWTRVVVRYVMVTQRQLVCGRRRIHRLGGIWSAACISAHSGEPCLVLLDGLEELGKVALSEPTAASALVRLTIRPDLIASDALDDLEE